MALTASEAESSIVTYRLGKVVKLRKVYRGRVRTLSERSERKCANEPEFWLHFAIPSLIS